MTRADVLACYFAHPDWSSGQIANELGGNAGSVRAMLRKSGVQLASKPGRPSLADDPDDFEDEPRSRLTRKWPHQSGGLLTMTSFPEPIASILPFPSDGSCTDRLAHTSKPSLSVPFPSFEGRRELKNLCGPTVRFVVGPSLQPRKQARRGLFIRLYSFFLSCVRTHAGQQSMETEVCRTQTTGISNP